MLCITLLVLDSSLHAGARVTLARAVGIDP
jgi:hypothetical protein